MPPVPASLLDTFSQETDRLADYFNLQAIYLSANRSMSLPQLTRNFNSQFHERRTEQEIRTALNNVATDPYTEFLRQFTRAFGRNQGLNLFPYIENKYKALNILYKSSEIQSVLPRRFEGPLNRAKSRDFWMAEQKSGELARIEKQRARVSGGTRFYTPRMERYLLTHANLPVSDLAEKFNKTFGTSKTKYGLRDKLARLQGRKPL